MFLKDFHLMKSNAIKFNGSGTLIAEEGSTIFQIVTDKIEESRGELTHLEDAVNEQMSSKPKKKKRSKTSKSAGDSYNLGSGADMWDNFNIDDISDDSD
jgi:hypothetical protein